MERLTREKDKENMKKIEQKHIVGIETFGHVLFVEVCYGPLFVEMNKAE